MSNNDIWPDIDDDEIRIIRNDNRRTRSSLRANPRPKFPLSDEAECSKSIDDKDSSVYADDMESGLNFSECRESRICESDNISDSFDRDLLISPVTPDRKNRNKSWLGKKTWLYALAAVLVISAAAVLIFSLAGESVAEGIVKTEIPAESSAIPDAVNDAASMSKGYVDVTDTVVGEVALTVLYPNDAEPTLQIGEADVMNDSGVVLAVQAADIRGDNGEIAGAYVMHGELKARGKSKSGFCAIVNGEMTIGVADATPLLEKAIEDEGYFFRQYPLVVGGQIVENKPKGRSLRKALAEIDGRVAVVLSEKPLTFHEFSQALVNLGVSNAIYLVGSTSSCVYKTVDGNMTYFGEPGDSSWTNVNYIVWR